MDPILGLARLLLSSVFLVAGTAKLLDRDGSQKALTDFGVPARLATPLAIFLPLFELGVGLAFIHPVAARWAALAALGLLFVFVIGIATNLLRGRRPACRCFGQ